MSTPEVGDGLMLTKLDVWSLSMFHRSDLAHPFGIWENLIPLLLVMSLRPVAKIQDNRRVIFNIIWRWQPKLNLIGWLCFILPANFSNTVQVHIGYIVSVLYKGYMSIPLNHLTYAPVKSCLLKFILSWSLCQF